jgi:hypothetical protein
MKYVKYMSQISINPPTSYRAMPAAGCFSSTLSQAACAVTLCRTGGEDEKSWEVENGLLSDAADH